MCVTALALGLLTLAGLTTRLVVPLLPPDYAPRPSRRLNPVLRVGDDDVVMMTPTIDMMTMARVLVMGDSPPVIAEGMQCG